MKWSKIWKEFDTWFEGQKISCETCHKQEYQPDWPEQALKIQELVNAELKVIKRCMVERSRKLPKGPNT